MLTRILLQRAITAKVPQGVCLPSEQATLCYGKSAQLSGEATTAIVISPNGHWLVSSSRKTLRLWDLATGKLERSWTGSRDWVTALSISPDNHTLATSGFDPMINLWDLRTGALLSSLQSGRVTCLEFSPDGQTIASGSRIIHWPDNVTSFKGIQLWHVATQRLRQRLGTSPITAIAFSPNSQWLAAGSKNTQVWQLNTRKLLYTLNSGELTALLFSRDSQQLITGSSKTKIWGMQLGELVDVLNSSASDLAFSPDGETLAMASGGTVNLWELGTRTFLGNLRGSWYSGIFVAFGLKGHAIVAASSDGLRVWRSK